MLPPSLQQFALSACCNLHHLANLCIGQVPAHRTQGQRFDQLFHHAPSLHLFDRPAGHPSGDREWLGRTVTDEFDPFSARDDPGGAANVGDQDPARTASPSRVCSRAPAAARRARRWDDAEVKEVENGLWVDLRPWRQRGHRVRALGVVELAVDDAPAQGLDGEAVHGAGACPASQSR